MGRDEVSEVFNPVFKIIPLIFPFVFVISVELLVETLVFLRLEKLFFVETNPGIYELLLFLRRTFLFESICVGPSTLLFWASDTFYFYSIICELGSKKYCLKSYWNYGFLSSNEFFYIIYASY